MNAGGCTEPELGPDAGERVLRCLRTAESLLRHSSEDQDDLRYAESAAYNLREALNSAVKGKPAGEGGFAAALKAWEHYKVTSRLPGADEPAARAELATALDNLASDRERQAYMTSKLLEWFREQSGVEPISGDSDPTVQYQRLRDSASRILHGNSPHAEVDLLFRETVAWFVRFFTPPSDIVGQLVRLAERPYSPDLLVELRSIAMNSHHLRLFLERLEDSAWLDPMRECGLIGLPRPGELWPVNSLARALRAGAPWAASGCRADRPSVAVARPGAPSRRPPCDDSRDPFARPDSSPAWHSDSTIAISREESKDRSPGDRFRVGRVVDVDYSRSRPAAERPFDEFGPDDDEGGAVGRRVDGRQSANPALPTLEFECAHLVYDQ